MIEFLISEKPLDYLESFSKMEMRVNDIAQKKAQELVWFLEHTPVLTAGTSFKEQDLLSNNLPVIKTNRGGQYTLHAPNQRVCYLLLDLKKRAEGKIPDVRKYVMDLENIIIDSLARFEIKGEIREGRVGVWVLNPKSGKEEKIAAIGIRLTKGITMHGFALNINNDLSLFQNIVPCGIREFGVCSFESLGKKVTMQEVDLVLMQEIKKRFS